MKKLFKTLICCILMVALSMSSFAFAANYTAVVPTFEVLVNGDRFYSDPPVIVIDGRTYLPLRALGDCLGVYVEWDSELGQVEVSTTKEVLPKEPAVADGYAKFDDVPDLGKTAGLTDDPGSSNITDFGYITTYVYEISEDSAEAIISSYLDLLTSLGFTSYFYDSTDTAESALLLNAQTGRLINLLYQGNAVAVSIFEEKHSEEEWTLLDAGQKLPQKEYDAVTAGFKVYVDGEEFVSENPPIVVEDRTYLPLRAMGDCLGVSVEWNEEVGRVEVIK